MRFNNHSNDDFDSLVSQLKRALRADGDFPARARTVSNLISLANNSGTPVQRIAEVLLSETSLGTRVLYTVNSVYFLGLKPIVTVTEAVIRIGMRNLCDLFAGLVLMQGFIPLARRGGIFAENLKRNLITALLASALVAKSKDEHIAEQGFLAGSFHSLGYLLLAYYFPRVYDVAAQRALMRGHDVMQSVNEIVGIDPATLHLEILDALKIPSLYRDIIANAYKPFAERTGDASVLHIAHAVGAAASMADTIVKHGSKAELDKQLELLAQGSGFTLEQLQNVIKALPEMFRAQCKVTGMSFLRLPQYLEHPDQQLDIDGHDSSNVSFEQFAEYIEIIKQAIDEAEPISSVITSAMEALVFALKYDRVILLLADQTRSNLSGKMALGKDFNVDPKELKHRILSGRRNRSPDVSAFLEGSPRMKGEPLFQGCAPFAAIPIGLGDRAIGVIYADVTTPRDESDNRPSLANNVKPALDVLAELLDISIAQSKQ